jgi:hypothetical protein
LVKGLAVAENADGRTEASFKARGKEASDRYEKAMQDAKPTAEMAKPPIRA